MSRPGGQFQEVGVTPNQAVSDGLLKVEEASIFTGLSRSKLYELMKDGRLQYIQIGAARRIGRAVLVAFLAQHVAS